MLTLSIFGLLALSLAPGSRAKLGVDVGDDDLVSVSTWNCLMEQGFDDFAIVRIYRSKGFPDANAPSTIKNARAAGIARVEGYIFPKPESGNPRDQVREAIRNLEDNGAYVDQIWIDVEEDKKAEYWSDSSEENVDFITQMIQQAQDQGFRVGIYTQKDIWISITGNSNDFAGLHLWYAHDDSRPSFNDFWTGYGQFGGWNGPNTKQYRLNANECGVKLDKNWRP